MVGESGYGGGTDVCAGMAEDDPGVLCVFIVQRDGCEDELDGTCLELDFLGSVVVLGADESCVETGCVGEC